jgi:hypothetical protein
VKNTDTFYFISIILCFLLGCHRWTYQSDGWCVTHAGMMVETSRSSCSDLQRVEDYSLAVHWDAGIDPSTAALLRGVLLKVHPQSDGGAFPPTIQQAEAGWREIYGDSALACWSNGGPVYLASFNWAKMPLCHELAHLELGCLPGDHAWMNQVKLDSKCGLLSTEINPLTGKPR